MPLLLKDIESEFLNVPDGTIKALTATGDFGTGDYVAVCGLTAFVQDYSQAESILRLFTPLSHGFVTEIEYVIEAESPTSIKEEKVRLQGPHTCERNYIGKVATGSADICTFISPKFDISGASKIIEDSVICDFHMVSPDDIFTAATTDCYTGGGLTIACFSAQTWTTDIYENGVLAASNYFHLATTTGGTPTLTQVVNSIAANFNSLSYEYTLDGTSFEIEKPFGVTDLLVEICVDLINDGAICDGCDEYCTTGCTDSFSALTSASTNVYIVEEEEEIDFNFNFTADTESFDEFTAMFKFEVYKYNHDNMVFEEPALYKSEEYEFESFSATSAFTAMVPIEDLSLDGDYLIKGYYEHGVCPEFLNYLDLRNDTSVFKNGSEYGLYNRTFDYHFVAINDAEEPIFNTSTDNLQPIGRLVETTIFPQESGQTEFIIARNVNPEAIVTLNGLTLANNEDYTLELSGDTAFNGVPRDIAKLTLVAGTVPTDIINLIYVANTYDTGLAVDIIDIDKAIVSGVTDAQGSEDVFFNTTEGKYEIYTMLTPVDADDIIVTLNGVTLANNIDYYQSITNPKRIILEGLLYVGDIINIIYNAYPEYFGDIFTQTPTIYWSVAIPPQLDNGRFVVEIASDEDFTTLVTSAETPYVVDQSAYSAQVTLTGGLGTKYYYRVSNFKEYVSLTGDLIKDTKYSEIVPIVVQSNSLNSY